MRTRLVPAACVAASAALLAVAPRAARADELPSVAAPPTVSAPAPTRDDLPPCLAELRAPLDDARAKGGPGATAPIPLHELKACYLAAVRPAIMAGRGSDAAARNAIRFGSEWRSLADSLSGDEELARHKWEARKKMISVASNAFWRAEERCSGRRDPAAIRDAVEWARVASALPAAGPNDPRPVPPLDAVMAACARFELRVASRVRLQGGAAGRDLDARAEATFPLGVVRARYDLLRGEGAFEVGRAGAAGQRPGAAVPARVTLVLVDAKAPAPGAPRGEAPDTSTPWAPRPLVQLELAPDRRAAGARDDAGELAAAWPTGFQALHLDAWAQDSEPPRFEIELATGEPGGEAWARATTRGRLQVDAAHPAGAWSMDERFFGAWEGETEWTLVHVPVRLERGAPAPAAEPAAAPEPASAAP